jgi:Calcineurin-like phosphoesterase
MINQRVLKAQHLAQQDGENPTVERTLRGQKLRRRVAIGDPQAPLLQFLSILDANRLLGEDGRLAEDVYLVSLGDHFDWGTNVQRQQATREGLELLAWLAAHPADQVTLLLGNHDLARVGEMVRFEDDSFEQVQEEATRIYTARPWNFRQEKAFLDSHPGLSSIEVAARDFACFNERQRDLVRSLLLAGRFQTATAIDVDFLLCHAGFTEADLKTAGIRSEADAEQIANAMNACLDLAVKNWNGLEPLSIDGLHLPGSGHLQEGKGIFYHRPEFVGGPPRARESLVRRFDPRTLPKGITQVVGHTRDLKCRKLLGSWADSKKTPEGALRFLRTDGQKVHYAPGVLEKMNTRQGALIFADANMGSVRASTYQLLDLDSRRPFVRTGN